MDFSQNVSTISFLRNIVSEYKTSPKVTIFLQQKKQKKKKKLKEFRHMWSLILVW